MTAALKIEGVSYAFGARQVLNNVGFSVPQGRVTMLLGPNGAGKTTLFSLIAGLLECRHGKITRRDGGLGIVFQQPALDLELTVAQNLHYYAALHGLPPGGRIPVLLQQLELGARADDKVRDLNGGHRRRVEIARALLAEPALLLLDEPTTGLDLPTRHSLVTYLHQRAQDGLAILWATHLADEVAEQDHVVVLKEGRVTADGTALDLVNGRPLAVAFTELVGSGLP